jgi:hypothetical protein
MDKGKSITVGTFSLVRVFVFVFLFFHLPFCKTLTRNDSLFFCFRLVLSPSIYILFFCNARRVCLFVCWCFSSSWHEPRVCWSIVRHGNMVKFCDWRPFYCWDIYSHSPLAMSILYCKMRRDIMLIGMMMLTTMLLLMLATSTMTTITV